MFRKMIVVMSLATLSLGGVLVGAPSEADAQERRVERRVHHSKTKTKTRKHHKRGHGTSTRRGTTHRRSTHGHTTHRRTVHRHGTSRSSVQLHVGGPYWSVTTGHRHHGHGHGHHRHRTHRHRVHYDHGHHTTHYVHRDVVIVDSEPADPVFVMPSMSCPIRTEEQRAGLEQWCATDRGTRHGPYRRWYADGQIASEGEFAYDLRHGMWLEFHPNGVIREEGEYSDDERIGTWTTWGSDGEVLVAVDY